VGEEEGTVTDTPQTHAGFAEISGAPLYYEVTGVGQPLVLLHQGFADSRMFDDQVAAFAAHCQVIRYDRHGSGRSGVPSIPYTHHAALRDLLRHLDIARAPGVQPEGLGHRLLGAEQEAVPAHLRRRGRQRAQPAGY